jgi:hypothetical protein
MHCGEGSLCKANANSSYDSSSYSTSSSSSSSCQSVLTWHTGTQDPVLALPQCLEMLASYAVYSLHHMTLLQYIVVALTS